MVRFRSRSLNFDEHTLNWILAYEFEVFLRGGSENVYTWRDAKNYCMSLYDGWQLAIIDSQAKQDAILEAFHNAGAGVNDAAWLGYLNDDGWSSATANWYQTLDLYGNRAKFTNYDKDEPNNKYGNMKDERGEDCVKMVSFGTANFSVIRLVYLFG